jgi:hypothetical protein
MPERRRFRANAERVRAQVQGTAAAVAEGERRLTWPVEYLNRGGS